MSDVSTTDAAPKKAAADGKRMATRRKSKKTESLTERVYQMLRTEILTCILEPGQEISEAELAERFEVSKTPVREALATLRSEGLVKTFPRRGYQVVPITFGDLNELFDLRTILEAGAAELACERITDAEIASLQKLAEVVYDRSEQPSLKRFIQANRDFHVAIAKASGNERLYNILGRQIDELERFFYLGARLRDVSDETRDDHKAIVEVLRSRDPVAARKIMIQHNDVTRRGLFLALSQSRNLSSINL
ncbi:GntR family transcriptional regulator [Xaviernesmea oryzae]|uniref:DNA-binding transcriptional regulator, GntR family n=1 Tax=Xaviernesmea oryzae TaxID=464029 RepID=A0A1X7DCA1_9HYPH|nr:GntR family transcriptional regulator [Xaviernesmea oryzae]SMF12272.1 DNA-binding transcriptional regulator, GntR family [Xaviernesmea oryzae]